MPVEGHSIECIIEQIPASRLGILFGDAQRTLDENWVADLTENFNTELFGHIDVTLPNEAGVCHIMDGQHRWCAAKAVHGDDVALPCRVHAIDAYDKAARTFADLNTRRKKVDELSLFFARRAEGRDDEVRINMIVRQAGLAIGRNRGDVSCPNALLKAFRRYGASALSAALHVLKKAYGNTIHGKGGAYASPLVSGLTKFFGKYEPIDLGRLVQKLQSGALADPRVLLARARAARQTNHTLKTTPDAVSFCVLGEYNRNAKKPLSQR